MLLFLSLFVCQVGAHLCYYSSNFICQVGAHLCYYFISFHVQSRFHCAFLPVLKEKKLLTVHTEVSVLFTQANIPSQDYLIKYAVTPLSHYSFSVVYSTRIHTSFTNPLLARECTNEGLSKIKLYFKIIVNIEG